MEYITASRCAYTGIGTLLTQSGATTWYQFSYTYIATSITPTLQFVFDSGPADCNYLDDVSVVDNNAPTVQRLTNPSFESSSSSPTSWTTTGTSSCASGTQGQVTSTSSCHSGSGNNCWRDQCRGGYEYLTQSFTAIINDSYTISFWLQQTGGGAGCFYADII
jgi:hypothetical protein